MRRKIIAFIGMPGAGKTLAASVASGLGFPVIRFGDITDEILKEKNLEKNEKNERGVRENLREELGMAAYAIKNEPRIEAALQGNNCIVLDGVRSFEEYEYLRNRYETDFVTIGIIATHDTRCARLRIRKERPLTHEECLGRDEAEIKKLNHGSTLASADYYIINEQIAREEFKSRVEELLNSITGKE